MKNKHKVKHVDLVYMNKDEYLERSFSSLKKLNAFADAMAELFGEHPDKFLAIVGEVEDCFLSLLGIPEETLQQDSETCRDLNDGFCRDSLRDLINFKDMKEVKEEIRKHYLECLNPNPILKLE